MCMMGNPEDRYSHAEENLPRLIIQEDKAKEGS